MAHEEHTDPKLEMDECAECQEVSPREEEDYWERSLRRKRRMDMEDYEYDPPMMRDPQ